MRSDAVFAWRQLGKRDALFVRPLPVTGPQRPYDLAVAVLSYE